jgi:hypothetical protein
LWHIDHFIGWNRESVHRIHHRLGGLAPHLLDTDASFAALSHLSIVCEKSLEREECFSEENDASVGRKNGWGPCVIVGIYSLER